MVVVMAAAASDSSNYFEPQVKMLKSYFHSWNGDQGEYEKRASYTDGPSEKKKKKETKRTNLRTKFV